MARLGLFGGCFNPVHFGHIAAARATIDHLGLDSLLFIPTREPPKRRVPGLVAGHHRLTMLDLALAEQPHMAACPIELRRDGPSFTIDTVAALQADHDRDDEWFFLLGADCLNRLPDWKGIDQLHAMVRFAILPRDGRAAGDSADPRLLAVPMASMPISSTRVRAAIAQGASLASLVPAPVAVYIAEHGLYAAGSNSDDLRATRA